MASQPEAVYDCEPSSIQCLFIGDSGSVTVEGETNDRCVWHVFIILETRLLEHG